MFFIYLGSPRKNFTANIADGTTAKTIDSGCASWIPLKPRRLDRTSSNGIKNKPLRITESSEAPSFLPALCSAISVTMQNGKNSCAIDCSISARVPNATTVLSSRNMRMISPENKSRNADITTMMICDKRTVKRKADLTLPYFSAP